MNSLFAVALDAPQTRPTGPPSSPQTAEWEQQTRTRFPRRVVYDSYWQTRPNRDLRTQLRTLQRYYTILDRDRIVIELLEEETALFTLLIEAVRPLQIAFGEKQLLHVRVQYSDDDSFLKVAVQLPANFGDEQAEQALWSFDMDWWLKNCHRSAGALVFDYEIQDAI